MGLVLCLHSPGMNLLWTYACLLSLSSRSSFPNKPACGRPNMPFVNSMNMNPLAFVLSRKLYSSMILSSMSSNLTLIYFRLFQWGHQIKVGNVQCHESSSWCGYDTIREYLGHHHYGCGCCHFFRIIDAISAHCSYSRNSPEEIGTEVSDTFSFNLEKSERLPER